MTTHYKESYYNIYITHNLLNVLVQIANKMGFKKIYVGKDSYGVVRHWQKLSQNEALWN
jgi:hypothetical protein